MVELRHYSPKGLMRKWKQQHFVVVAAAAVAAVAVEPPWLEVLLDCSQGVIGDHKQIYIHI